jgi:hypothetical protein
MRVESLKSWADAKREKIMQIRGYAARLTPALLLFLAACGGGGGFGGSMHQIVP